MPTVDLVTGELLNKVELTPEQSEKAKIARGNSLMRAYLEPTLKLKGDKLSAFIGLDGERRVRAALFETLVDQDRVRKDHEVGYFVPCMMAAATLLLLIFGYWLTAWTYVGLPLVLALWFLGFLAKETCTKIEKTARITLSRCIERDYLKHLPSAGFGSFCTKGGSASLHVSHIAVGEKGIAFKWDPEGAIYAPFSRVSAVAADLATSSVRITLDYSDVSGKPTLVTLVVTFPELDGTKGGSNHESTVADLFAEKARDAQKS